MPPEPVREATPVRDIFTLTSPPAETAPVEAERPFQSEPVTAAPGEEPELFTSGPMTFETFDSQQVAHHEFDPITDLSEVEPARGIGVVPVLLALGLLGLIMFSGGLFWIVKAKGPPPPGLLSNPMVVGGGLGIVGILCVASAVYFLLERLGGREEQ